MAKVLRSASWLSKAPLWKNTKNYPISMCLYHPEKIVKSPFFSLPRLHKKKWKNSQFQLSLLTIKSGNGTLTFVSIISQLLALLRSICKRKKKELYACNFILFYENNAKECLPVWCCNLSIIFYQLIDYFFIINIGFLIEILYIYIYMF